MLPFISPLKKYAHGTIFYHTGVSVCNNKNFDLNVLDNPHRNYKSVVNSDKMKYELGETNLTPKIGKDAGKVWRVLDTWGEVDVSSISRLARLEENDVFSAIGWLAREGKIEGRIINAEENKIKFWLK